MDYLSIHQASEKWGTSTSRIEIICSQNLSSGTTTICYAWVMPPNAVKPIDARTKSGKYIKHIATLEESK